MFKWIRERKEQRGVIDKVVVNTFTKKWMARLMWVGLICVLLPYLITIVNQWLGVTAEMIQATVTLSEVVCATTFGSFVAYMARAFFDTKSEKDYELRKTTLSQDCEESEE